jgi:hypothetical protein
VSQVTAPVSAALAQRRPVAVDMAIVASSAAALAHVVATPSHYIWWPAAGVFFAVLGAAQLIYAALLVRGYGNRTLVMVGIWSTVGVILLYVASRTVGIPMAPPVPFHGGHWVIGRSAIPNGAKHVGPLDVFTLVAELTLALALVSTLPAGSRVRTVNRLMWIGLALWGAAIASVVR